MQHLSLFHSSEWNQCVDAFLRSCSKSQSPRTQTAYQFYLRQFFVSPAKYPPLYSRADVEVYLASASRRGGPSISLRNARLTALAAFYRFAANFHILDSRGVSRPLLAVCAPTTGILYQRVPRRPRAISADDLQRFFAAIPTETIRGARDRAIYLLLFWSGRRRREIASLHYGNIQKTVFREPDGTRRPGWLYSYVGKGNQPRSMELPHFAKIALDHYLEVSGRLATIQPDDPLFLPVPRPWQSLAPNQALSGGSIYANLKKYARQAGLNPTLFFPHAFRHSAAQQRWQAGQDILSIQEFLGHASLETTRGYLTLLTGQSDPGAKLLENRFGSL